MSAILFVVSSPDRRGAETFAVQLAGFLEQRGHQVSILALEPADGPNLLDIQVAGQGRWNPRTATALLAQVRRHDLVVAHGGTTLLPTSIACRIAERPLIYRNIGDPTAWGSVRGARIRIGLPLRSAAHVAALYPRAKEELIGRYGLDPHRVSTLTNAVPSADFQPVNEQDRNAATAELGLDPQLDWVGYVGSFGSEKRPDFAIAAILGQPGIGLVMAGDGPELTRCRALASEHCGERVKFLGRVSNVGSVLRAVSALAIPSRTEGVSGSAIEAALCGIPVVTTDVGGMATLVLTRRSGLVLSNPTEFEFGEGLAWAVENRAILGLEARSHALAHFTMEVVGEQWERLIGELLSRT